MNNTVRNLFFWLVILIILLSLFNTFGPKQTSGRQVSYSKFLSAVNSGDISSVVIEDNNIVGEMKGSGKFATYVPNATSYLLGQLTKNNVDIVGKPPEQRGFFAELFIAWFPMFLFLGIWIFIVRQQMGGRGGAMGFWTKSCTLIG
ncbi:MAG: ATP-dependent metallopeptidase FtsH/Yme1/Tma family protein [Gammaproteobacteria bacterium]|nr:ATP-dependent metallopeptidase FtsH/Yme1/Tma family protein [Gammaproteobacteria bacterium]